MCRVFIRLFLTWFVFLQAQKPGFAQSVSFAPVFNTNPSISSFLILGRHNDKVYVLSTSPAKPPNLLIYDKDLQLVSNTEQPMLQNSAILAFLPGKSGADLLFENAAEGYRNYKTMRLSKENETTLPEKEILSLPREYADDWDFAASPGNKFFVLHKLYEIQKDTMKMSIIVMDSGYEVVDGKKFSFYVEGAFERMGNPCIDDDGNIYFIVHDQPLNYKLGTRLKLYKYISPKGSLLKKEFYMKEKKPVDIILTFYPAKGLVYLHALYNSFYTGDISGILSGVLNDKMELVVPFNYYEFDKKFKKNLNTFSSGISSSNLMNYLHISNTSVSDSSTAYVTATLEPSFINPVLINTADRPAKQESKIMETNPLLAIGQREYMIRREMRMSSPVRGRRISVDVSTPSTGYAEAYANVMSQRPDLFFVNPAASSKNKTTEIPAGSTKVPNRQIVFAFDKNAGVKWHRSYVLENQNPGKSAALPPAETDNGIVSLHYRLNKKETVELAFTRVAKADGSVQELPLTLPENISLLTNGPVCTLSSNSVAIFYFDKTLNKMGLAKVEW